MASTTFTNGTLLVPSWLNDVNKRVYTDVINVCNAPYNAVGDGVTDDTAAIIAALDYLEAQASGTPKLLRFGKAGVYKITDILGSYAVSNITIDLNGSTLDASSVPTSTNAILEFSGTYSGTAVTITSNAASEQKTVACTSTTFAANDMVRIYSETVWDSLRTGARYGELNWIETVPNGTSVTCKNYLASTYTTADTAKIQKVTPVENIVICNGRIIGPSANDSLFAIRITLGVNILIHDLYTHDFDVTHIQLKDCTLSKVIGCSFKETNASTTGYGVSVADAAQDILICNNTFTDIRHAFTTGNSIGTSYGITRRIKFDNNVVTDSATTTGGTGGDAVDTHAGCEDIVITNNMVFSSSGTGINCEGRSCIIRNNLVISSNGNGITHQNYTDLLGTSDISENTIRVVKGNYALVLVANSTSFENVTVNGNNIISEKLAIFLSGSSGKSFEKATVNSNTVNNTGGNTGIQIEVANVCSVVGNAIESRAVGVQCEDVNNVSITGNSIDLVAASGSTGYGVRVQGTSKGVIVSSNVMKNTNLTNAAGVSLSGTTYSGIFNNAAQGMTAATIFNDGGGTGCSVANNITVL